MSLAPIALFVYNRIDTLKQTVEALQKNYLAPESELIIFSDAGKDQKDQLSVQVVREYLKTIVGFKTIIIHEAAYNKGLATSIIEGVTMVLDDYESIIVLEDDLIISKNFLDFINQALEFYKKDEKIFSVSGWSLKLETIKRIKFDNYVHLRMSSWGWGIWKDKWTQIPWEKNYYINYLSDKKIENGFKKVSPDLPRMLKKYISGKNQSWAIRASFFQFLNNKYTVAPKMSKVNNIGFGKGATHTKFHNFYDDKIDTTHSRVFSFEENPNPDYLIFQEIRNKYHYFNKLISLLNGCFYRFKAFCNQE